MSVVKDRGLTGAILDELWPILGGSHTAASVWTEIEDALSPVIAKHRQSAIAELCEGLRRLLRADIGDPDELIDAESAARTLLSKHSPDAPGDAGTRAIEPSDGDEG